MQRIETYTKWYSFEKFNKDQKTIDAVIMMLVQLWETAFQIHHNYPKNPLVATKPLKAMRNFLVHSYHRVDTDVIRDTIKYDLPELKKEIKTMKST